MVGRATVVVTFQDGESSRPALVALVRVVCTYMAFILAPKLQRSLETQQCDELNKVERECYLCI